MNENFTVIVNASDLKLILMIRRSLYAGIFEQSLLQHNLKKKIQQMALVSPAFII